MATTTKTKAAAKTSRYNELKKMLEDRRRELMNEVQGKIRDVRADGSKDREVLDQGESSEVDIQEDIEFALIQMKSETLNKIDAALRRLEEGTYGNCFECGDEIAEARLRALPFAVRCKDCEEARETRRAARAHAGAEARFLGAVLRHVELTTAPTTSSPGRPCRPGPDSARRSSKPRRPARSLHAQQNRRDPP